MFCGGKCKPSRKNDMLKWNAATKEVLLDMEGRGDPPASRALCPACRFPLKFETGSMLALLSGTAICARSGEEVSLTAPHFKCQNEECEEIVSLEEGPGVVVDPEYDVYNEQTKTLEVEVMNSNSRGKKGQRHTRSVVNLPRDPAAIEAAKKVMQCAKDASEQLAAEDLDMKDADWQVAEHAFDAITAEDVMTMLRNVELIFAAQPTLVEADVPCKIVGDTHGQLRDVLLIFNTYGWPAHDEHQYCFNGDYVDRGKHQCEVALLVMAAKVISPTTVWLLRGNHEEESVNRKYGFDKACTGLFGLEGERIFKQFHSAFNQMPLGCLVGKQILSLHGGIGDGKWDLDKLRSVQRPITGDTIHHDDFIFNILWSDPIEEDDPKEHETSGLHTSPRSKRAVKFGWNVTIDFCIRNDIGMVCRSHQYKKGGFGFDVMHDNMLIRVFTARDYEGKQDNDGSILSVQAEETGDDEHQVLSVRPQVIRSMAHE